MNFLRRPAVSAPAALRGNTLRRDGDPAVRRGRESDAGDSVVPRGFGAKGRQQSKHKRLCEPRHRRPLLLQGPCARLSGINRPCQHLHTRAAEHSVAEDPVRARRRCGQGGYMHILATTFFDPRSVRSFKYHGQARRDYRGAKKRT